MATSPDGSPGPTAAAPGLTAEPGPTASAPGSAAAPGAPGARPVFAVRLSNFEGPFDLLLSLIAKHRLDITEVALAQVTDEFIAHLGGQTEWDLGQASEFLLVAATLLDLKAARLLPRGAVEDDEDLELLEARDLLFARLLQYRAFKDVAAHVGERWARNARSFPRSVALEPQFAALLPELVISIGPERLAELAAAAFAPKPGPPQVELMHMHAPVVPVAEQAAILVDRLRRLRSASFRTLTEDAASTAVVVSRFLALLELFRDGSVAFDQAQPLGELTIRWSGPEVGEIAVVDEYDDAEDDGADDDTDDDTDDGAGPDEDEEVTG